MVIKFHVISLLPFVQIPFIPAG